MDAASVGPNITFGDCVAHEAKKFFIAVANTVSEDAWKVAKLAGAIFDTIREFGGIDNAFLRNHANFGATWIDLFSGFALIKDLIVDGGEMWNSGISGKLGVCGIVAFIATSFFGLLTFIEEAGAFSVSAIAESLKNVPGLGTLAAKVAAIGLERICIFAALVGYTIFAVKAGIDIYCSVKNHLEYGGQGATIAVAVLELISKTCSVAFYICILVPGVGAPGLVVFGLVNFGTAVAVSIIKYYLKDQLKAEEKNLKAAMKPAKGAGDEGEGPATGAMKQERHLGASSSHDLGASSSHDEEEHMLLPADSGAASQPKAKKKEEEEEEEERIGGDSLDKKDDLQALSVDKQPYEYITIITGSKLNRNNKWFSEVVMENRTPATQLVEVA